MKYKIAVILSIACIIILSIVPVFCYYPGYFDKDYKAHETAVENKQGTDRDLYETAINDGYSQDIIEQMIEDGYMLQYIDELKDKMLIPQDFNVSNKKASEEMSFNTQEEKSKGTYLYKESYENNDIFIDEQDNIIYQTNNDTEPISISVNGMIFNVADIKPCQKIDGHSSWIFVKPLVYDSLKDTESIYVTVVAKGEKDGGMWPDGRYWGDVKVTESKYLTEKEKTTNVN